MLSSGSPTPVFDSGSDVDSVLGDDEGGSGGRAQATQAVTSSKKDASDGSAAWEGNTPNYAATGKGAVSSVYWISAASAVPVDAAAFAKDKHDAKGSDVAAFSPLLRNIGWGFKASKYIGRDALAELMNMRAKREGKKEGDNDAGSDGGDAADGSGAAEQVKKDAADGWQAAERAIQEAPVQASIAVGALVVESLGQTADAELDGAVVSAERDETKTVAKFRHVPKATPSGAIRNACEACMSLWSSCGYSDPVLRHCFAVAVSSVFSPAPELVQKLASVAVRCVAMGVGSSDFAQTVLKTRAMWLSQAGSVGAPADHVELMERPVVANALVGPLSLTDVGMLEMRLNAVPAMCFIQGLVSPVLGMHQSQLAFHVAARVERIFHLLIYSEVARAKHEANYMSVIVDELYDLAANVSEAQSSLLSDAAAVQGPEHRVQGGPAPSEVLPWIVQRVGPVHARAASNIVDDVLKDVLVDGVKRSSDIHARMRGARERKGSTRSDLAPGSLALGTEGAIPTPTTVDGMTPNMGLIKPHMEEKEAVIVGGEIVPEAKAAVVEWMKVVDPANGAGDVGALAVDHMVSLFEREQKKINDMIKRLPAA